MSPETQILKLFISGMSVRSIAAIENVRNMIDTHSGSKFELEIIDISKMPDKAVEFQIFAVPALIRVNPQPKRTFIGDLKDTKKISEILDINQ